MRGQESKKARGSEATKYFFRACLNVNEKLTATKSKTQMKKKSLQTTESFAVCPG